jgi:hypothetical protein
MAVYIPAGHGGEDLTRPRSIVPEGCSVTVIETCGGAHYWGEKGDESFEYLQLTNFLKEHPEQRDIFSNPKENSHILNDIFGSVAIYGPGEKYPNIRYQLCLEWHYGANWFLDDVRYSGLIPFDTFVSPDFTTQNIKTKLINRDGNFTYDTNDSEQGLDQVYLGPQYNKNDIWLKNNKEIYKYSVYPTPEDFTKYFSNDEGRKQLFLDTNTNISEEEKADITLLDRKAKKVFASSMQKFIFSSSPPSDSWEGYINVSLESLMTKFPGHYIHIVCRGTPESNYKNAHMNHTQEEVFTKRIPYMSPNQKRQGIANIEQSRRNKKNSKSYSRSSKNTRNIMLAGLKKSLVQNELLSKVEKKNARRYTKKNNRRKIFI